MSDINRFNLVDEPWIPIVGSLPVSLRQLFTERDLELAGNPIQKIALLKLLLAIAQAAYTPADDEDWRALGVDGMAKNCLAYLDKWHHKFWLYGSEPFLQMPGIERAEKKSFGAVMPEIATGNTTIFTQSQVEKTLSDAQKAVLIITLMGFALGGKKTDSTVSLSPEHVKKTGRPGTHVGYLGYLHHFLIGRNCLESLWLNLLTMEGVQEIGYQHGIGVPPWEKMPEGEICPRANDFKNSLMGRLVPLSRFCLLTDSDLHYSEGISHPSHGEGGRDPTIAIDSSKKPKAMWTDPSKRPWRWLSSMLGFLSTTNKNQWHCLQLSQGLRRARTFSFTTIGIWSAGLRVSGNAGEQYVSGTDDFVESRIELQSAWIGDPWFIQLQAQMEQLEDLSKVLGSSVRSYFKEQKVDGSEQAHRALSFYWQLCEKEVHALLKACDETGSDNLNALWKRYVDYARAAFDSICPKDTARQLDAWSKHRSNVSKFINKDKKKKHER